MSYMKNRIKVLFVALFSMLVQACGNNLKNELDLQQAELMKLHDEVMPKSMRIDKIKSQLATFGKEKEVSDSLQILIMDTSLKLGKANEDMYLWMKNFGTAMNDVENLEEKKKLYDESQPEIERIAKETDDNIQLAKEILGE